jgi:hypothetical protein
MKIIFPWARKKAHRKKGLCRYLLSAKDHFFREPLSAKSFLPQAPLFAMMFFGDRQKNGIFFVEPDY